MLYVTWTSKSKWFLLNLIWSFFFFKIHQHSHKTSLTSYNLKLF